MFITLKDSPFWREVCVDMTYIGPFYKKMLLKSYLKQHTNAPQLSDLTLPCSVFQNRLVT